MPHKILFVSSICCIRVAKEGFTLIDAGDQVFFLHGRVANVEIQTAMPWQSYWKDRNELFKKITSIVDSMDIDLIQCHNEPDWLVSVAKEAVRVSTKPKIPVIFDVHDLNSIRSGSTTVSQEEILAFKDADGFIFPAEGYMNKAFEMHSQGERPSIIVESRCMRELYESFTDYIHKVPKVRGIVYEGGISLRDDDEDFNYRDYRNMAHAFHHADIPFHIYGVPAAYMHAYEELCNAFLSIKYTTMISRVAQYDWGLCGNTNKNTQWKWAMPNKLFEYMVAGVPTIALGCEDLGKLVQEYGIGISVESVDEIKEHYDKHRDYRENVLELRKSSRFHMEGQVGAMHAFYQDVLDSIIS